MSQDTEKSLLYSGGDLNQMLSGFQEQSTERQDDDYPDEALPVICCCIVILFVIMILLLLLLSTHYSGEYGDDTSTPKVTYIRPGGGGGPATPTTSEEIITEPPTPIAPETTTPTVVTKQSTTITFGPVTLTTGPLTPPTSTSPYPVPTSRTPPATSSTVTTKSTVPKTTTTPTAPPSTTTTTARTTPSTTTSTRKSTTRSTTRATTTTSTRTTPTTSKATTTRTSTSTTTSTTTTSTTTSTTSTTTTTTTTRSTTRTTTTSTTSSTTTTTSPPTTTELPPLPGKPRRNFTLICVFEYLLRVRFTWNKTDQCTDYVYIRAFTYFDDSKVNHDPLVFTKKTLKSRGFDIYLGTNSTYWDYINRADFTVRGVKRTMYPHADWYIGMWGSTYLRLLASFWEPLKIRDSLHNFLRQPNIGWPNTSAYDGFAIINTIIRNSRADHQAFLTYNYSIFRGKVNPILPPHWRYIHTAAVWAGGNNIIPEKHVKNFIGVADIVGLSTSNTTDEPNRLQQAKDSPGFYWASPPNPIRSPNDKMRGMLDMLRDFPHWKTVLNRNRICFSVSSSINYARDETIPIDFIGELGKITDSVQRYTRYRFITRINATAYPVEALGMKYEFDTRSHTHFWKTRFYSGGLQSFFAYDDADTLRYKMEQLLNAYPGDKCVVFDDLGDDFHEGGFTVDNQKVEFKKYGLLHVVSSSMVQRYGQAFPPQFY